MRSCRFTFGGTSSIPFDWIEKAYAAGGTNFDAMAVHPYSHPYRPEGVEDVQTERLRELMAKYGVGDRPIWFTEVGWPTHAEALDHASVLLAGLSRRGIGFIAHALTPSPVADLHAAKPGQGFGYNMPFMSLDGAVRPGHGVFNEY